MRGTSCAGLKALTLNGYSESFHSYRGRASGVVKSLTKSMTVLSLFVVVSTTSVWWPLGVYREWSGTLVSRLGPGTRNPLDENSFGPDVLIVPNRPPPPPPLSPSSGLVGSRECRSVVPRRLHSFQTKSGRRRQDSFRPTSDSCPLSLRDTYSQDLCPVRPSRTDLWWEAGGGTVEDRYTHYHCHLLSMTRE